jgi:hypothetical protein
MPKGPAIDPATTTRGTETETGIETETEKGTGIETDTETGIGTVTETTDIEMTGEGIIVTGATTDGKKDGGPALVITLPPPRILLGKTLLHPNLNRKTRK